MTAASDGRNRRRFPRVPVRGEVSGRIHTVAAAPVLDLSEGGALLEVPCVLRPRSLYIFRLSLGEGQVLSLQSSVVRSYVHSFEAVGQGESRVQYRAAIQFTNLTEANRELLRLRLYGSREATTGEAGAVPHDPSPEELLGELLASEASVVASPSVLDGLTALLEESGPFGDEPEPRAQAPETEPLPPLPDVEPLPPLPDVAPWPPAPGVREPEPPGLGPVQATTEEIGPRLDVAPEASAEDATAGPAAPALTGAPAKAVAETAVQATEPAAPEPVADEEPEAQPEPTEVAPLPADTAVERRPEAARGVATADTAAEPPPEIVRAEGSTPARHSSAWQRIKGWISSRPIAERARGSSILGLGLDVPAPSAEKPLAEERRDFARVVVEGAVAGEMGLVMQSDIEALSVGGLMARMPFAPQAGAELSFTIEIDDRPIVVGGTVRNVQEIRSDGDVEYQVGLEFGPLDDEVRTLLKGYVDRRLEEGKTEYTPVD